MNLLKDRRGFIDLEVMASAGFVILFAMAVVATTMGYIWGKRAGMEVFPVWQLILIYVAEFMAAYFFAARG